MQRISVNVTNDCDGNQLNYNNDLPAIRNKKHALQKPFETDFFTVISNAKLQLSFVICWVVQGNRPRCGPRHPILRSNIFFYVKLFPTIIPSWNSSKCILWYLLNCQIHLLIIKIQFCHYEYRKTLKKNLLLSLENEVYFFKKGNPIFSIKLGRR